MLPCYIRAPPFFYCSVCVAPKLHRIYFFIPRQDDLVPSPLRVNIYTVTSGRVCGVWCKGGRAVAMRTRGHEDTRTRGHADTRTRGRAVAMRSSILSWITLTSRERPFVISAAATRARNQSFTNPGNWFHSTRHSTAGLLSARLHSLGGTGVRE